MVPGPGQRACRQARTSAASRLRDRESWPLESDNPFCSPRRIAADIAVGTVYISGVRAVRNIRPPVRRFNSTEPGSCPTAPRWRPIVGPAVTHPFKPLERLGEHRQRRRAQLIIVPPDQCRDELIRLRIQCSHAASLAPLERGVVTPFGGNLDLQAQPAAVEQPVRAPSRGPCAAPGMPRDTAMRVPQLSAEASAATRYGRVSHARTAGVVVMKVRVDSTWRSLVKPLNGPWWLLRGHGARVDTSGATSSAGPPERSDAESGSACGLCLRRYGVDAWWLAWKGASSLFSQLLELVSVAEEVLLPG